MNPIYKWMAKIRLFWVGFLDGLESHHFRAKGHGKNQCGCRVGQARSQRVLPKLLKGRFPELQQDVAVPKELSFGAKCPI